MHSIHSVGGDEKVRFFLVPQLFQIVIQYYKKDALKILCKYAIIELWEIFWMTQTSILVWANPLPFLKYLVFEIYNKRKERKPI